MVYINMKDLKGRTNDGLLIQGWKCTKWHFVRVGFEEDAGSTWEHPVGYEFFMMWLQPLQ